MWENNASPMLIGWPEYEADNIKKTPPRYLPFCFSTYPKRIHSFVSE